VDGELSPEMTETVATHLAACAACSEAASQAAEEMSFFVTALEPELSLAVPTERLRERLDTAIAGMSRAESFVPSRGRTLSGWFASLAELFRLTPQRALGFASLVAVVAFALIFAAIQQRQPGNDGNRLAAIAPGQSHSSSTHHAIVTGSEPTETTTPTLTPKEGSGPNSARIKRGATVTGANIPGAAISQAGYRRQRSIRSAQPAPAAVANNRPLNAEPAAAPLPGEQSYLKAIATLTTEIEASGETALRPSLRAEYERNLAVVDQAIDSTRRSARRNPKDPDAAAFLYSSYQSKLDLLSAIAEQARPSIALR
jgi:hypothetical protein